MLQSKSTLGCNFISVDTAAVWHLDAPEMSDVARSLESDASTSMIRIRRSCVAPSVGSCWRLQRLRRAARIPAFIATAVMRSPGSVTSHSRQFVACHIHADGRAIVRRHRRA
jgi:hypothetical protein